MFTDCEFKQCFEQKLQTVNLNDALEEKGTKRV